MNIKDVENKIIENYSKYLSTYLNTENKFSILHALSWFSMFESVTFYLMAALCDSFKNCYSKSKLYTTISAKLGIVVLTAQYTFTGVANPALR